MSKPRAWKVLHSEDGDQESMVVPSDDTPVIDALLKLVEETYGSPVFAADNPAIIEAAKDSRIERWRSCTKKWREDNDIYSFDEYWSIDGDGARSIFVLLYEGGSGYDLGEAAAAQESSDDR